MDNRERELFEKVYHVPDGMRHGEGYKDARYHYAWEGWQAARTPFPSWELETFHFKDAVSQTLPSELEEQLTRSREICASLEDEVKLLRSLLQKESEERTQTPPASTVMGEDEAVQVLEVRGMNVLDIVRMQRFWDGQSMQPFPQVWQTAFDAGIDAYRTLLSTPTAKPSLVGGVILETKIRNMISENQVKPVKESTFADPGNIWPLGSSVIDASRCAKAIAEFITKPSLSGTAGEAEEKYIFMLQLLQQFEREPCIITPEAQSCLLEIQSVLRELLNALTKPPVGD